MNSEHHATGDLLTAEAADVCLTSGVGHGSGSCAVGSAWSERPAQNESRSESAPSRWEQKSLCRLGSPLPRPSLYKRCLNNKMYLRCFFREQERRWRGEAVWPRLFQRKKAFGDSRCLPWQPDQTQMRLRFHTILTKELSSCPVPFTKWIL